VFDPTAGPYEALVGGCLPAITGYISHWESITEAVKRCLEMVRLNGEGTPGVCKAVLSYYVCDAIWDSLRCLGGGLTAGTETDRPQSGMIQSLSRISQAASAVTDSVTGRYGETAMFDTMFRQRKLIHGACIGFFTGDMTEFDLNAMFSAEIGMPALRSEGLVSPATRRYLTSNPFNQGWATFMYHIGYALNAGSDLNYELKLVCSNDLSCPDSNNEANPGACDCYTRGEQLTRTIASGTLSAGDMANEEKYIKLTEPVRYDKVVLEWTYTDNTGEQRTDRIVRPIKLVGESPPSHCGFSNVFGEYRCEFELGEEGAAFFIGTPMPSPPAGRPRPDVFRVGDKLVITGQIGVQMPEQGSPVPRFLTVLMTSHNGELVADNTVMLSTTGSYLLESFPQLFPTITQDNFRDSAGNLDCDRYDLNHPATWDVYVVIYKAEQSESGEWKRTDEVELYEGQPQYFRLPVYVACSEEEIGAPQCPNGAIWASPQECWCMSEGERRIFSPSSAEAQGKYCCNGVVATAPCDEAAPKFNRVMIRTWEAPENEPGILSKSVELSQLQDGAVLLMPYNKVEFPEISISDDSEIELELVVDGSTRVGVGSGEPQQITSFEWEPEMGGDSIKEVTIQFEARDVNGLVTRYPQTPKRVELRKTLLQPISS